MLEALTGTGLATAAGLNAYIPMLTVGLVARFTGLLTLPDSWNWLENGWVLGILGVLLAVEFVADKVPAVDSVNDVLQTVVRPTAGGLTFGATSVSESVSVTDPDRFFDDHAWVPITVGIVLALLVHVAKSVLRPVANLTTGGLGAPVLSTIEDGFSLSLALVAIVVPLLVLAAVLGLVALFWWMLRRRRRLRAGAAAPQPG